VPELPEVETVVRDLRGTLVGRRLTAIRVSKRSLRRPWSPAWTQKLVGKKVQEIQRRGKWILIVLDGELQLVIHLGMTGQLCTISASAPVAKHTHVVMTLNKGDQELRFCDVRRFGSATLFGNRAALDQFFEQSGLGPEPFDLDTTYWNGCLATTSRCLKAVLLDQKAVAGVGNIYADEALFEARLHPSRLGRSLDPREAARLRKAVVRVLHRAITKRGSSIRTYIGGSGLKGNYQEEFRVYGRAGEPCRRCRQAIERIRLAGRSTHFCPHCQPACRTAPSNIC
jgi:formamidopyrimidine-DNA glycosylase